ncbi:PAS domain-containing protein [Frateuria terrea]|uniref:histidine kinase n=1 Tax=Frateuria terrea TaxID=529704 RepID=A0A1H6YE80_9GAMM|nr:PAS domain-containing protein [Frateuria terrea]SEJ35045.1 PAS domain S-box-containing protein [Frateuria terrea]SFP49810.1 PAS domain S-box-containing protein [Frateuria terrea]
MVQSTRHSSSWPVGPGEMAECIRRHDWAATALGPIAGWPPHLRTALDICLASPIPTAILWGDERLQLYNDAYRPIARERHPAILGRPVFENWPDARELIRPMLDRVFASGEPTLAENWPVLLDGPAGAPVERFFTFSFSAIRDRYGGVGGALHTAIENTARVRAGQRLRELTNDAGLGTDFRALFQAAPAPLLLLAPPDFHVVAANDAMLRASGEPPERLLGRPVFELFARWPNGGSIEPPLRASLERVLVRRTPDSPSMVAQHGLPGGPGPRWWSVINTPVLDQRGEVALIIQRAEDLTELVRLRSASEAQAQLDSDQQALMARLREAVGANTGGWPREEEQAPQPQAHLLGAVLDSICDYVYAFDREHRLAYANRATRELFGPEHDPIGRTLRELGYPRALAQRLDGHIQRILETGQTIEDEVLFTSPAGTRACYQFVWGPVRGGEGGVERVVGVSRDISERRRMEERLRQGEARQSFLLQMGDRIRGLNDAGVLMATVSDMVGRHLRVGRCGYGEVTDCGQFFLVERDWTDGVMPSLAGRAQLAEFGEAVVTQYRAGQTVVLDDTLEDARTRGAEQAYAGAGRVRAGVGVPLVKGNRFVAAFYVHQSRPRHWRDEEVALLGEVAERTWAAVARARAERALRESEQRYRALFDAIDEGFCLIEKVDTAPGQPSDYRYLVTNPAFARHTGIGGVVGRTMRKVFPDAAPSWYGTFDSIIDSGEAFRFEHGLITHGRVFDVYACRLDDGTRRRVAVIFNDITERKRHEQHQRLLLHELNHRVKNTLVTVQSMAMQTFRPGADPEQAREQFEGRLMALSRAHDILTRESWSGASLAAIVQEAIAPYRDQRRERLYASGPPVWLPPRHALAFAMVLHELGTNAVKYGALSSRDGRVDIGWTANESLRLRWVESGGPAVVPPARRGFGSRLIERGLRHEIGGRVILQFAAGGVVCTIEAPLHQPGEAGGGERQATESAV